MNFPALLLGTYKEAQLVCNQAVKSIKHGESFRSFFEKEIIPFPENSPHLMLLQGPNPIFGNQVHGHVYLPLKAIFDAMVSNKLSEDHEDKIFAEFCQEPWSVLALISPSNLMWLQPPERHQVFLSSCLSFWPQFEQLGSCYTTGMAYGKSIWTLTTNLKHILARHGVAPSLLNESQSEAAIQQLIRQAI